MKKKIVKFIIHLLLASLYIIYMKIIEDYPTFITSFLVGVGIFYISKDITELIYDDDSE